MKNTTEMMNVTENELKQLRTESEMFKAQIDEVQKTVNCINQNLTAVMEIAKTAFPEAYKAHMKKKGGEDG